MGLEGKGAVRGLDKVAPADAPYLGGHTSLIFEVAHMLDHRVRENDVELSVTEAGHITPIAGEAAKVCVEHRLCDQVEQRDLETRAISEVHQFPERLHAADVKDADRSWEVLNE